mgnify:CR=1 FL=1
MSIYQIFLIGIGSIGLFSGGFLFGVVWNTVSIENKLLFKLQNIVNNICDEVCPNDCAKRKEMIKQLLTKTLED